jgi:hypothetical protein
MAAKSGSWVANSLDPSAKADAYFPAVDANPVDRFLFWKSPCGRPVHG